MLLEESACVCLIVTSHQGMLEMLSGHRRNQRYSDLNKNIYFMVSLDRYILFKEVVTSIKWNNMFSSVKTNKVNDEWWWTVEPDHLTTKGTVGVVF